MFLQNEPSGAEYPLFSYYPQRANRRRHQMDDSERSIPGLPDTLEGTA